MAQRTDPCFLTDKRGEQIMKETTLVIMAAGIGSRFGKGIKQLAPRGDYY